MRIRKPTRRPGPWLVALLAVLMFASPVCARASGPFLDRPDTIAGAELGDVSVLDFNGDGIADIATAGHGVVELIRSLPDGWAPSQSVAVPVNTLLATEDRLATADLNGDGREDLVVAIPENGQVLVIRGRADGTLTAPAPSDIYTVADPTDPRFAYPPPTAVLALGDVDGNGSTDVVAGFSGSSQTVPIAVLANDGHAALTKAATVPVLAPRALLLTRLGGDDDLDLVVAEGLVAPDEAHIVVVPGATGAGFGTPMTPSDAGRGSAIGLADGDFNQDGATDVVVGRAPSAPDRITGPAILPGRADAPELGAHVDLSASGVRGELGRVATGDIDRDGREDIATDDAVALFGVGVLRGTGGFTFTAAGSALSGLNVFRSWTLGDADDDGKLDLLGVTVDGLQIYYGSGPRVQPQASDADFGDVGLGDSSAPLTGSFVNRGPGTAAVAILLGDGDIDDFPLDADRCSGATLPVGTSCSMTVRFEPTAAGDRELDAAVVAPDSDEAFWVALYGTGIGRPAATAAPSPPATRPRPPAAPPAAAATLTRARTARVTGRPMRLDTGWRTSCPAGASGCRVEVLVVARGPHGHAAPVLAHATVAVAAGRTKPIVVSLTPRGIRALRGGKAVHAIVRLTATRPGTTPVVVQRDVTLRRPGRH